MVVNLQATRLDNRADLVIHERVDSVMTKVGYPHIVKDSLYVYRVSKKLCKVIFYHHFVKFPQIVKFFGTKIAKRTSFCEVYSFATSPNLCQRTTVLNAAVKIVT